MADHDQNVSAINKTQRWKEFVTGFYARLNGAILYGLSTGSSETALVTSTDGALHVKPQASTAAMGHVILDASTAKIGALQGSTEGIGQVGGHTALVTVNLAPTTSAAYAQNDLIGAQISIAGAFRSTAVMTGVLQSIVVADKSTMQASIDFVFFHTNTTGTTYTNDSALTLDDADLVGKCQGHVSIYNSDYVAFAANTEATLRAIGLPIKATTGTTLYAAAINRSSAPQYTSTGDLSVTFGILQD